MPLRLPGLGMYATELLKCSSFAFGICTAASLTVEQSVVNSRSQACNSRTDAVRRSQDVRPSSEDKMVCKTLLLQLQWARMYKAQEHLMRCSCSPYSDIYAGHLQAHSAAQLFFNDDALSFL